MKKLFILIILLFCLIPASVFATIYPSNYEDIFYDSDTACICDSNGVEIPIGFLPEDLYFLSNPLVDENSSDPIVAYSVESDDDPVLSLNGINYNSLSDAFDNFPSDELSIEISLLQDDYSQTPLVVPEGYHVTIILNESSIISESNYIFIVDGDLYIIGAGDLINTLGGGIYNRGIGLVRLHNCVNVCSQVNCLVNNKDGSIYVSSDCSLACSVGPATRSLDSGAGTINALCVELEEPYVDTENADPTAVSLGLVSSVYDESLIESDYDTSQLEGILDEGTSFLEELSDLILSPPYIYILGSILVLLICILIRKKFM